MLPDLKTDHWKSSSEGFLRENQSLQIIAPNENIRELLANGKRTILVVAAHQDDDVIGPAGTLAQLSRDIRIFKDGQIMHPEVESKGLQAFSPEVLMEIQRSFNQGSLKLKLIPDEPKNIIALYVTDGAKTPATVAHDIKEAHPNTPLESFYEKYGVKGIDELTENVNKRRHKETLSALDFVGGHGAISLNYPSRYIKDRASDRPKAIEQLSQIIELIQPEEIYTHSQLDTPHDTHVAVSELTLEALRLVSGRGFRPESVLAYSIWKPAAGIDTLVDITSVVDYKRMAVDIHSRNGTQGDLYGRDYATVIGLNGYLARFQRNPRLPGEVEFVEAFQNISDRF